MYRTLLWVLRQSQWQSIAAAFPSYRGFPAPRYPSSIDEWVSRPFPGFWTCTTGFLVWRSPFHSTTARTNIRTFCLSSIDDIVLGHLTRVYWHALYGPSLLPQQCQASSLLKARPRRTECRNCHDARLRFSNLKRNHETLLRLLIDQSRVTGDSDLPLILQHLETLQSRRVTCWNSRVESLSILGGSYVPKRIEYQRSANVVGGRPDKLNRERRGASNSANSLTPISRSGVASDKPNLFSPWGIVTSTMKAMIWKGLRIIGLCEPLLERGKSRVRWRCVSTP